MAVEQKDRQAEAAFERDMDGAAVLIRQAGACERSHGPFPSAAFALPPAAIRSTTASEKALSTKARWTSVVHMIFWLS